MSCSQYPGFAITVLFLFWAVGLKTGASQDKQLSEDADHFVGIFDAHLCNLDAWESGDVLIKIRSVSQGSAISEEAQAIAKGPDAMSVTREETRVLRFTFDFPGQRYRVVTSRESEILIFDALEDLVLAPERKRTEHAFVYDKAAGVRLGKLEPGKLFRVSENANFEYIAGFFGIPSIQSFGVSPGTLRAWNRSDLGRFLDSTWTRDNIQKVEHVGADRYRVSAQAVPGLARFETDWDTQRNVPVKHSRYSISKPSLSERLVDVELIEWQELGGVYVPSSMRGQTTNIQRFEGRRFVMETENEFDFLWFSLNEELDQEVFAEQQLHDITGLNELISEKHFDKVKK